MTKTARRESQNPRIGTVTRVYEHIGKEDDSNFEADVQILAGTQEEQRCPIESSGSAIDIPEVGDKVIIGYRQDGKKPFVKDKAYSVTDRPPVGTAGIYRREVESGPSPAGDGNLYLETNTNYYDKRSATDDVTGAKTKHSVVRISKRPNSIPDPTLEADVPAKVEFYDEEYNEEIGAGASHIKVAINNRHNFEGSGFSYKGAKATWGMNFNIRQGTISVVGPKGFGIQFHGDGTFTWHVKNESGAMNFKEHDSKTGPLNLSP